VLLSGDKGIGKSLFTKLLTNAVIDMGLPVIYVNEASSNLGDYIDSIYSLSSLLVNRPGRFHYHICFKYPTSEDIVKYLKDKLDEKYWGEIPKVVKRATAIKTNYDTLRAIAYELQQDWSFDEAIFSFDINDNDFKLNVEKVRRGIYKSQDGEEIVTDKDKENAVITEIVITNILEDF
jgi:hypothetical protein